MAASKLIVELMRRLVQAKGDNTIARGGLGGSAILDKAGTRVGSAPGQHEAAKSLNDARQNARAFQPDDPLATEVFPQGQEDSALGDYQRQMAYRKRDLVQDPTRLPGPAQIEKEWEVIIEETGAYGQPVFATKTVKASSADDAIRKVESEGDFPFIEDDPMTGEQIQSMASVKGMSDDPGFMVHAQPAQPQTSRPISPGTILPDDDIPF